MTYQFVREYVVDAKVGDAQLEALAFEAVKAAAPHLLEARVQKDAVQGRDEVKLTIIVEPKI